jgi:hypothetical protein
VFFDNGRGGHGQVVISVKSGKLKPDDVRALRHVVEREGAEMGALITLQTPSSQMRADAMSAGDYHCPWGTFQRIQIVTVEELLEGGGVARPMLTREIDVRPLDRRGVEDAVELQLPLVVARQRTTEKSKARTARAQQLEADLSNKAPRVPDLPSEKKRGSGHRTTSGPSSERSKK